MGLAVDIYKHLIKAPAPLAITVELTHSVLTDLIGEQRSEPVPPEPYSLMTNVDAVLEENILHITQAQGKSNVHQHRELDNLGRRVETAKGAWRLGSRLAAHQSPLSA